MKTSWGHGETFLRKKVRKRYNISERAAKIIFLLIISTILVVFILGDVGLVNLWSAKKKIKTLEKRITVIKKENEELSRKIRALKNDPFEIEKIAREKFGYLKPGEKVYRLIRIPDEKKKGKS